LILRNMLCWLMIGAVPSGLMASDTGTGAAMLYGKGTVWLNGGAILKSSSIFPGDLVQTKADAVASINSRGTSVVVLADSVVKFENYGVAIDHGTVSVTTSKSTSTRAGDLTVTPASANRTEFDVKDVNGTVQIIARKGALTLDDGQQTSTLPEGQQTTRDDTDKRKKKRGATAAPAAASGSILNSTYALGAGAAAAAGLTIWVLTRSDEPLSPSTPK
jgi:hypothetical protein